MKPVEIGCLGMIISVCNVNNSHLIGKVGTVVSQVHSEERTLIDGTYYTPDVDCWVLEFSNPIKRILFSREGHNKGEIVSDMALLGKTQVIRVDGDVDEESECDEISKLKETM